MQQDSRAVPNDEPTTREYVKFADYHATELRRRIGVADLVPIDPLQLADKFQLKILRVNELSLTEEELSRMRAISPKEWSGGGGRQPLPDGRMLVLLHPDQTPERERITVMEEVAHRYFGHGAVQLPTEPSENWSRHYDNVAEREAYWTAAATLLPSVCVGHAVWQSRTGTSLAEEFGVSIELVEFRIKTLFLWKHYVAYAKSGNTSAASQ